MSKTIYLNANKTLDIDLLGQAVAEVVPHLRAEKRSETLYYFWIHEASARGIDVSIEHQNMLEFRNTICSNEADYRLTNQLVELAQYLFGGTLVNEEETVYLPVYTNDQMLSNMQSDAEMLKAMAALQNKTLTLYGPKRKIHIGPRCFNAFNKAEKLEEALNALILKVNYSYPAVTYGNVMETSLEEKQVIFKLLTNEEPCIIDKYDYLLFEDEDSYLVIKNDDLNRILPDTWQLLDEYTIYAPTLSVADFAALKNKAQNYNVFHTTFGKDEADC